MLWELTLRFKVLPPSMTAGILAGVVLSASALAWKRDLVPVFWVANVTTALVALALSVATRHLPPFIAVLLLMALACEAAAGRNRELSVRPLVAAAADVAVWALVFIYSGAENLRADYPLLGPAELLAPALLLFLIYAVSVTARTVWLKRKISVFETGQTLIAFLLAACSLLYFVPGAGAAVLGVLCLALSAASYVTIFVFLERTAEDDTARRNLSVFAAWSAALFLAGSWPLLPPIWLAACFGVAALAATVPGIRTGRVTLQIHGLVYLLAAAVASGLPAYALGSLAGALPASSALSVSLVAVCAVVCYAAARPSHPEQRGQRLIRLVPAVLAVCAIAALTVQGLAALGWAANPYHLAFIRTFTTCALALALAFSGSRWQRTELNWIAYATLVFVAAKLLFEDLLNGHLGFIAASIFVFAVTLLTVPRLARMGQNRKAGEL
jgi:hypothetical protein